MQKESHKGSLKNNCLYFLFSLKACV